MVGLPESRFCCSFQVDTAPPTAEAKTSHYLLSPPSLWFRVASGPTSGQWELRCHLCGV